MSEAELKAICTLPEIEELWLAYEDDKAGDAGLAPLGNLKNLRRILLMGANSPKKVLQYLEPLKQLEWVSLPGTPFTGADPAQLWRASGVSGELLPYVYNVTDDVAAHLHRLPNLRHLLVGKADAKVVSFLAVLPHLEVLEIGEYDPTPRAADFGALSHLKRIYINSVTGDRAEQIDLPNGSLRLEAPEEVLRKLSPRAARHVVSAEAEIGIEPGTELWPPERRKQPDLSWLGAIPGLRELTLVEATDRGIKAIAGLTSLRALTITNLCSGEFSVRDEGMKALEGLRNLESLTMEPSGLTESGMLILQKLMKLRRLEFTGAGPAISARGLANVWSLKELRVLRLDVSGDGIQGNVEAVLAGMKGLGELEELALVGDVPDAALAHLASVKKLRLLDLSRASGYTDEGLAALMDASSSLRTVKVTFSPRTVAHK